MKCSSYSSRWANGGSAAWAVCWPAGQRLVAALLFEVVMEGLGSGVVAQFGHCLSFRTVETADFTQGTLLPEGEQEELSSRAEDCSTPHEGQLPKDKVAVLCGARSAE